MCRSVVQCVAVCCGVVRFVAMFGSVLQYVRSCAHGLVHHLCDSSGMFTANFQSKPDKERQNTKSIFTILCFL